MAGWWIAWLMLGADAADPMAAASVSPPVAPHVSWNEPNLLTGLRLRAAVQAALRRRGQPAEHELERTARELLVLYRALEQDRQLAPSTRRFLQAALRSRLAEFADRIDRQAAAQATQAHTPQTLMHSADRHEYLAQQRAAGARGAAKGRGAGGGGAAGQQGTRTVENPGSGLGSTGLDVAGWQLAELIRQTIAPSTWDVRGGPGTIYYWSPGRALVVRQTTEVHEDIANLLDQMERLRR